MYLPTSTPFRASIRLCTYIPKPNHNTTPTTNPHNSYGHVSQLLILGCPAAKFRVRQNAGDVETVELSDGEEEQEAEASRGRKRVRRLFVYACWNVLWEGGRDDAHPGPTPSHARPVHTHIYTHVI